MKMNNTGGAGTWWRWGIGCLLLWCAGAGLWACQGDRMPREIIGTWVTDNARYAGAQLIVSADQLILEAIDATAHPYTIRKLKVGGPARRQVTIQAVDADGNEFQFVLIYSPADGGTLRLWKSGAGCMAPQTRRRAIWLELAPCAIWFGNDRPWRIVG